MSTRDLISSQLNPKPRKWKKKIVPIEKNKVKVFTPYMLKIQEQERKELTKDLFDGNSEDSELIKKERLDAQIYEKNLSEAENKLAALKNEKHRLFLLLKNCISEGTKKQEEVEKPKPQIDILGTIERKEERFSDPPYPTDNRWNSKPPQPTIFNSGRFPGSPGRKRDRESPPPFYQRSFESDNRMQRPPQYAPPMQGGYHRGGSNMYQYRGQSNFRGGRGDRYM
jgi:hypothetical protein